MDTRNDGVATHHQRQALDFDPGDIHVAVRSRTLTISGERKASEQIRDEDYWLRRIVYGSFERSVTLPEEIDATAVRAYRNGVLDVEVPVSKELTARMDGFECAGGKEVKTGRS